MNFITNLMVFWVECSPMVRKPKKFATVIYLSIYLSMCVCGGCLREKERERVREKERE